MNSRRNFLAGLGTAALAPHALSAASLRHAPVPPGDGQYVVGVTSNPLLPGPAGSLVLRTWLSVARDGTGFGVLTDRYDSLSSSHLTVQTTERRGNGYRWDGVVTRSNDPRLLGQRFALSAQSQGGAAALELVLLGQTFSGRGLVTV